MDMTFFPAALRGTVAAPASKSEAHRRMICAGLTRGTTTLGGFMDSADMAATARCLKALGVCISQEDDRLTVTGFAKKPCKLPVLDCGESGSTLRFFVPIALALTGAACSECMAGWGSARWMCTAIFSCPGASGGAWAWAATARQS